MLLWACCKAYTGWVKMWRHKLMAIILSNLNRFSNFFAKRFFGKFAVRWLLCIHLTKWLYNYVTNWLIEAIDELTTNEDFDLAEVESIVGELHLHDEISARRHAGGAGEVDSRSVTHDTRILSAHVVVPQSGRRDRRRHVRQSNDEVIRFVSWKESIKTAHSYQT